MNSTRFPMEEVPPAAARASAALEEGHAPGPDGPALPADVLERWLGCPRSAWSEEHLVDLVRDRGIRLISLMHVGGDGWLKTLDFVPRSLAHARDVLSGGERADGSSIFRGLKSAGASDIVLRPRPGSAFLDPFASLPTLVLLCGHAGRDGAPLPESPDTIVRRADARLRSETGVDLHAHGEVEYFLGRRQTEGDIYGAADRGYHATSPFVFGEDLRRRSMAVLAEIGVAVKYGHSEVGYVEASEADGTIWEQHEIELALAPLPQAAEAVVLTHWVLRNLAHRHGMRCSFDPILRPGHAGTGMHFHLSPVVRGEHVGGRAPDGSLGRQARWLIAGLVRTGGALMAFGNRSDQSFVRLSQAREAPSAVTWGDFDRSALVRLPIVATTEEGRQVAPPTIEFRLPDGSAHPYLVLAGVAQAMIHGRSTPDLDAVLAASSASSPKAKAGGASRVPGSFREVAEALAQCRQVFEEGAIFPPSLLDQIIEKMKGPAA